MKETFKILSRLSRAKAHAETEITIDWEGTTAEQMQILARGFLVYCAQAAWAKDGKAPETHSILARLQAHPYVPMIHTYTPRPKKETSDGVDHINDLIGNLPAKDREEILSMLAAL